LDGNSESNNLLNNKLNITETDNYEKKEMNLKESMSSITFSPQFRNSEMNRGRISEFQKGDYPD